MKIGSVQTGKGKTMSRLIDADALLTTMEVMKCPMENDLDSFMAGMRAVLERICDAPTVDAVQVVRCKDCKKRGTDNCDIDFWRYRQSYSWYCASGERKSNEVD